MKSRNPADLVFIAFKGGVSAFDRYDGGDVWTWKPQALKGLFNQFNTPSFLTIARDGDRLIVASSKRVWCLDPLTGAEVWSAEVKNIGGGFPIIAGNDGGQGAAAAAAADAAATSAG
jgi:outer membrane protein assembly factor BamB